MKIYFSSEAERNLANIYYYIAVTCDSPQNAKKILKEIKEKINRLLPDFPEIGQSISKVHRNIRRLICGKYIITYSYNKEEQYILIEEIKLSSQNR